MKLEIHYFALFQDMAGKASETLEMETQNPHELYIELQKKYDFPLSEKHLKVAINDNFSSFDSPLKDGDKVVFIPPVAGG